MEPFDVAQSFMERAAGRPSLQDLTEAFRDAIERLGFRYFACCSHVDPLHPPRNAVLLHNFPIEWVTTYGERNLYEIDPVFRYAERTFVPFFWDDMEFRSQITAEQEQIFVEAAALGIASGYTIPIHKPCLVGPLAASCSIVPDSQRIETRSYLAVQLMAMYMYDAANRARESGSTAHEDTLLSLRERQCLELVAQGKSNWAIGRILRISEHTVHRHVESAKQRLGVATRMQAVIGALQAGQISVGDIRAPQSDRAFTLRDHETRPE